MSDASEIAVAYDERLELRQTPSADPWWQDSAFVEWYARDPGVGGVFRIGHEPNQEGGTAALWFGLATGDGTRYRRNAVAPLTDRDRLPDGFGALGGRYRITYDGAVRYEVDDEDCRVRLAAEDFYPPTELFPGSAGMLSDEFAKAHVETAGRITGTVELDGASYAIDGLYQRDRSFGVRRWDTLLNHRWMPGGFGADMSFGSVAWHAADGSVRTFGYLARGETIERAVDVGVVVDINADSTTHRGGRLRLTMLDQQVLEISARPVAMWLFEHHGTAVVESVCDCELDGRSGFCALEISTNPRAGTVPVVTALGATTAEGLSSV